MAVDIVHKPPKKCVGHLEQNSGLAVHFHFIKEIQKIYKGKNANGVFWLSFLTEGSNQFNFLTTLLHFERHRSY